MALDQRDYHTERIRQRTAYTEKAAFRVNLGQEARRTRFARAGKTGLHPAWKIIAALVVIVLAAAARKLLT